MTGDEYLKQVLQKYAIPTSKSAKYQQVVDLLMPPIRQWVNGNTMTVDISGSYAKGTTINISTDMDLFISLEHNAGSTLEDMYETLFNKFNGLQYNPRKQNVSIGIIVNGIKVDLIPARKFSGHTNDHNLWKHKQKTSIKTNIQQHINLVKNSGRIEEIKIIKIWRELHNLEFPSTYLELVVIEALKGKRIGDLATNVLNVLDYLGSEEFRNKKFIDPANSNNIISDDLTQIEKLSISTHASSNRNESSWGKIVW